MSSQINGTEIILLQNTMVELMTISIGMVVVTTIIIFVWRIFSSGIGDSFGEGIDKFCGENDYIELDMMKELDKARLRGRKPIEQKPKKIKEGDENKFIGKNKFD